MPRMAGGQVPGIKDISLSKQQITSGNTERLLTNTNRTDCTNIACTALFSHTESTESTDVCQPIRLG